MTYRTITRAEDVTPEILTAAELIFDGWFADSTDRINWFEFLDRLDGIELSDGSRLDIGNDILSPAIILIKTHIRKYRAS